MKWGEKIDYVRISIYKKTNDSRIIYTRGRILAPVILNLVCEISFRNASYCLRWISDQ